VHLNIFEVHVENAVFKLVNRLNIIHHLPDEMAGVIIDAEIWTGDNFEHLAPDARRGGQVFPAGPLLIGEEHGAVLDGHFDTQLLRISNDGRPDGFE